MADRARPFRLCVDLNVWVARQASRLAGRRDTAAQLVTNAVRTGDSAIGPVQLVVSHAMLTRLSDVLMRQGAAEGDVQRYIRLIASFATLGPSQQAPHLVLGGGVAPSRDAIGPRYDPYDAAVVPSPADREDGRVLDTALAGRADALVTGNIRDFRDHQDEIVAEGRIHIRRTADHRLIIIRTQEMAAWLRTGIAPAGIAETIKT